MTNAEPAITKTPPGNGEIAGVTIYERVRPYGVKAMETARVGQQKATAMARTGQAKAKTLHRDEPVALLNCVRLILFAGMTFGLKMTTTQLIASIAATEAVITYWTRQQVSPTGHDVRERRHAIPPAV